MMKIQKQSKLEFIGGPFDGYCQSISPDRHDLEPCIALPMNPAFGRNYIPDDGNFDFRRVAVYRLNCDYGFMRYQFRAIRRIANLSDR
ncbi:MAG: hypothetical protein JWM11_6236 [Planctomycetaceae bacterium]|nr:hypothetical protein [Planctomycetaceae bacterium]